MPKICYEHFPLNAKSLEKIEIANSILENYITQGYELTLRGLYYQMVSGGYIPNNDREYANLGTLINKGRMSGLVDWEHIVDITRSLRKLPHWNSPKDILHGALAGYSLDKWKNQQYRVEVWVEKDAVVGVVQQVCERLDVPCFSCRGYTGQAAMWGAAQRLKEYVEEDQQPVILHLGDHDPSGIDMSRDIEERLDVFINHDLKENEYELPTAHTWHDGLMDGWYSGIVFKRIALNMTQIQLYNPPPNPTKLTDARAKNYIENFGHECWELDALNPVVMDNTITAAINRYVNQNHYDTVIKAETEDKNVLRTLISRWDVISQGLKNE